MHKQILNPEQKNTLHLLKKFSNHFYLAGGTAIALQIGHRKSVDFDLFSAEKINIRKIEAELSDLIENVLVTNKDEYTAIVKTVKFTFLYYPFDVKPSVSLDNLIKMPTLLDLAAMKAYTVGRRNELKDYVDLFFLLLDHFTIDQIEAQAKQIFGNLFSEKLFRAQLVYFDDVDWTQKINFFAEAPAYADIQTFLEKTVAEAF